MDTNSQRIKKSNNLGMSFSTADYRLKKLVLFWLLTRLKENVCFRCHLSINSPDDLTLDHKQPWLEVDPALFWDLGNVAFSHNSCNAAIKRHDTPSARAARISRRKIGDIGTAWCRIHKLFLPIDKFSANIDRWNGLQDVCIECRSNKRSKKHGAGDPICTGMTNLEGLHPTIE